MRKKTSFLIYSLLIMGVFLFFANSCKKDDDKGNNTGIPVLTTTAVTDITQITATSGGSITSDGGATVTARGICWSTGQTPTISDNKTTDGTGAGNFVSNISGLTANTTYYVRAYATNSNGTAYGSAMSFTTQQVSAASSFTDSRDGNTYLTVTIGSRVWMAENLKYLPSVVGFGTGSSQVPYYYVYNYSGVNVTAAKATSNYTTYGVLYNWPAAMAGSASSGSSPSAVKGVCPAGWHLPSDAEWEELVIYLANNGHNYDGSIGYDSNPRSKIAKAMAATTHWGLSGNIGAVGNNLQTNNSSGFTALPSGGRYNDGGSLVIGYFGYWWSATESSSDYAWSQNIYYNNSNVGRSTNSKEAGFSVRCVRD